MAEELSNAEKKKFHKLVSKLFYLSKRRRADVLTEGRSDLVIGCLPATKDQKLILTSKKGMRVVVHIDAAFGTHCDGKSHSGATVFIGDARVLVVSKKQKIGIKDSTKNELVVILDLIFIVDSSVMS